MFKIFNETVETNNTLSLEQVVENVINWLATEGVKLLIGLIFLLIAFYIINVFAKSIRKRMIKKQRDKTVTSVVYRVIKAGLKILVFLGFLGYVGIDTAGIGGIIASIGVGVGLALQGSLSNLAGGVIILLMRPFKLGDYIEAQGESGTVEDIRIFYTYLNTPNNKVVMIPNGILANGTIINYSTKELRRVDFEFGIAYSEDFEKAKQIILDVINNTEHVLNEPAPLVRVVSHGDSSINITTKVWTKNENYLSVHFDIMEAIKKEFDKANIEIPYKTLDVNIKNK